jgi:hypothetical protein
MHTLGANPMTPVELLGANPSARRRRTAVDEAAPGGVETIERRPNRVAVLSLGSPTVDLVLANAPTLDLRHAELLAARTEPALDPWSAALLVARFGTAVRDRLARHANRTRTAAADGLAPVAEQWVERHGALSTRR